MLIDHGVAITLEHIVRRVYSCDRAGMGGYIDADHFESEPFDAALIALAPLWQRADYHAIEDFLFKWEHPLRSGEENVSAEDYADELSKLVTSLMDR